MLMLTLTILILVAILVVDRFTDNGLGGGTA
jgi:hypothetical protein